MRRYSLLISLFAIGMTTVWAKPVSKKAAQQTAQAFMQQRMNIQRSHKAPQMVDIEDALGSQDCELLYVFNAPDGTGFVIVSGDDRTEPILGYSTSGNFDASRMPDNMRSWLQHYAEQIAIIQKYDLPASQETVPDLGEPIPPQLRSNWIQQGIFNQTCPLITVYSDPECTQPYEFTDSYGNKTSTDFPVVGCTATALSQVLNHWRCVPATCADLPARQDVVESRTAPGTGTPVWTKYSDAAIPAGTPIDWDNILDNYLVYDEETGIYNWIVERDKVIAVADLCHICGVACNVSYGLGPFGGSAAYPTDCFLAARKVFGFQNVSACKSEFYSYQDYVQTLYDELKVARAVFFGGSTVSGGGHAFVVDGYDKEDLFHINWGWFAYDGYFRINDMNPQNIPQNGYTLAQIFARGLYPDAPAVAPELLDVSCETPLSTLKATGGIFTLPELAVNVRNIRQAVTNAEVGLTLEKQGERTTLQTDGIIHEVAFQKNIDLQLTDIPLGQLADGEYLCYPSFRTSEAEEWIPCREYEQTGMKLTVEGETMTIENVIRYQLAVLSSDNKSVYAPGEPIEFTATLQLQKGDLHYMMKPVYQTAADLGNPDKGELCGLTPMTYVEEGGTFQVTFSVPDGLPADTYTFSLQNDIYQFFHPVCTITVKSNSTGIGDAVRLNDEGEMINDNSVYDLSGHRISGKPTQHGVYIQSDRRKVLK